MQEQKKNNACKGKQQSKKKKNKIPQAKKKTIEPVGHPGKGLGRCRGVFKEENVQSNVKKQPKSDIINKFKAIKTVGSDADQIQKRVGKENKKQQGQTEPAQTDRKTSTYIIAGLYLTIASAYHLKEAEEYARAARQK